MTRGMATHLVLLPAAAASLAPDPPARPSCAVTPAKAEEGIELLHAAVITAHMFAQGSLKRLFSGSQVTTGPRRRAELMELIVFVS